MRDYLKRAYGVRVVSVRSYVQQQPITRISRDGRSFGAWRRPKSEKRMTVELKEPFVWPKEPKDLTKYVFLKGLEAEQAWSMHFYFIWLMRVNSQMGEGVLGRHRTVPAKHAQAEPPEESHR